MHPVTKPTDSDLEIVGFEYAETVEPMSFISTAEYEWSEGWT